MSQPQQPASHPAVTFNSLPQADGSATYAWRGYTVAASVNGPIEPQRRDELPEQAFLEVHLRPASGVGGTRERLLETIIHATLLPLLLTTAHPRALIQVTLQVLSDDDGPVVPQAASHLPLLPHLLHAAVLALLAANLPMRSTATAALVALDAAGGVAVWPDRKGRGKAESLHVFAFDGEGGMVLGESEGGFDEGEWTAAVGAAEGACGVGELGAWLRGAVEAEVREANRWRGSL